MTSTSDNAIQRLLSDTEQTVPSVDWGAGYSYPHEHAMRSKGGDQR